MLKPLWFLCPDVCLGRHKNLLEYAKIDNDRALAMIRFASSKTAKDRSVKTTVQLIYERFSLFVKECVTHCESE